MAIQTGLPIEANDFLHLTFFPRGAVLMYDGADWVDNSTLPGWYKCAGQATPYGNTPNMLNRFIRGAASSGTAAGSSSVTLTSGAMPRHKHDIATGALVSNSATHNHTVSTTGPEPCRHSMSATCSSYFGYGMAVDAGKRKDLIISRMSAPGHTHTLTAAIGYAGSSGEIELRPDYYRVIYIIKMV